MAQTGSNKAGSSSNIYKKSSYFINTKLDGGFGVFNPYAALSKFDKKKISTVYDEEIPLSPSFTNATDARQNQVVNGIAFIANQDFNAGLSAISAYFVSPTGLTFVDQINFNIGSIAFAVSRKDYTIVVADSGGGTTDLFSYRFNTVTNKFESLNTGNSSSAGPHIVYNPVHDKFMHYSYATSASIISYDQQGISNVESIAVASVNVASTSQNGDLIACYELVNGVTLDSYDGADYTHSIANVAAPVQIGSVAWFKDILIHTSNDTLIARDQSLNLLDQIDLLPFGLVASSSVYLEADDKYIYLSADNGQSDTESAFFVLRFSGNTFEVVDSVIRNDAHFERDLAIVDSFYEFSNQSDYGVDLVLGKVENQSDLTKSGKTPSIGSGDVPQDIWQGTGVYTGQPVSFTPELVTVVSSSANDASGGTGAEAVRIFGLQTAESTSYTHEDITLNGLTPVDSVNSYYRVNRAYALSAGSGETNDGVITIAAKVAVANVFATIEPGLGETKIAAWTIPACCVAIFKRARVSMIRENGSDGSGIVNFFVRDPGGVYRAIRSFDLSTSQGANFSSFGGDLIQSGSDLKMNVSDVSDPSTILDGVFELVLIKP